MSTTMQEIVTKLKALQGDITSEIINDLIREHRPKAEKMKRLYEAYKAEKLPILERTFPDPRKINNKLINDYRSDIVDGIVGYLFGHPLSYDLGVEDESALNYFYDFRVRNNLEDLDAETGKMASICGYAARLCYIDKDGQERVINVDPWECIFIEDGSVNEIQYAMRYYPIKHNGKEKLKIEWYDKENVTFYLQDGTKYIEDDTELKNPMPHMFQEVPLIKFVNNKEQKGDFEKVESLIDAYDRVMSDAQNEIEEFRNAYMVFQGVEIDEETIDKARQTGAFGLPDGEGDGEKVYFLTKTVNTEYLENHLENLNDNIYKFSKSVDMTDENFSGSAMSGEARKWKLLALENKAIVKERKFSKGLRQQFKVLCTAWNTKNINIDYLDIKWSFTRNLPVELSYEADTTSKLKGLISDKTRLSLLSFIDDVDAELERMKEENEYDLDKVDLGGDLANNNSGSDT